MLLLGLIALHVSAAFFHHFWRRDNTLTAMLPFATGRRPGEYGLKSRDGFGGGAPGASPSTEPAGPDRFSAME
jgi:hypothetical protein